MNWTEIILGLFTLLSTCGWFVSGRKHRQEIESLRADNRQKDMNLSRDYVTEWRTYIAEPLQREVGELRQEVAPPFSCPSALTLFVISLASSIFFVYLLGKVGVLNIRGNETL